MISPSERYSRNFNFIQLVMIAQTAQELSFYPAQLSDTDIRQVPDTVRIFVLRWCGFRARLSSKTGRTIRAVSRSGRRAK